MGQPERGKLPFSVKIAILCIAVSRGSLYILPSKEHTT